MSVRATVRELVSAQTLVPESDDAPLELTSLALVTLTEELEARFSFRVFARDLTPDHFQSISRICQFVESRLR